jgi:glycosyltransferase involved in cell wall biosynthesis
MEKKIAVVASSIHPEKQAHLLEWYIDLNRTTINTKLFTGSKSTGVPLAVNYKLNSKWEKVKYLLKGKVARKNQPLLDYKPTTIHLLTSNTFDNIKNDIGKNVKLIVSFRGYDINVFPFISDENYVKTQNLFKRANVLHFISNALRERAVALGADPLKSIVIKRSLNFEKLVTNSKIDKDRIIILSTCRLVWEKGLIYGLEAIAKLVNLHTDLSYLIIGDGIDKSLLLFHVKRLKLENNVTLLGQLTKYEVFAYYSKASIYLQPSLEEALSNSIMEASYFGLPVVSTNTGGIPEVIQHEFTGLLAPVADSQTLFEHLLKLVEDKNLRLSYGRNGHIKMVEEFNREDEIRNWLDLYKM